MLARRDWGHARLGGVRTSSVHSHLGGNRLTTSFILPWGTGPDTWKRDVTPAGYGGRGFDDFVDYDTWQLEV